MYVHPWPFWLKRKLSLIVAIPIFTLFPLTQTMENNTTVTSEMLETGNILVRSPEPSSISNSDASRIEGTKRHTSE